MWQLASFSGLNLRRGNRSSDHILSIVSHSCLISVLLSVNSGMVLSEPNKLVCLPFSWFPLTKLRQARGLSKLGCWPSVLRIERMLGTCAKPNGPFVHGPLHQGNADSWPERGRVVFSCFHWPGNVWAPALLTQPGQFAHCSHEQEMSPVWTSGPFANLPPRKRWEEEERVENKVNLLCTAEEIHDIHGKPFCMALSDTGARARKLVSIIFTGFLTLGQKC